MAPMLTRRSVAASLLGDTIGAAVASTSDALMPLACRLDTSAAELGPVAEAMPATSAALSAADVAATEKLTVSAVASACALACRWRRWWPAGSGALPKV